MELEPLNSRVIVRAAKAEEVSRGGIILPDIARERPQRGEVLAVGPGETDDAGTFRPTVVKPGDKVLFGKYAGTEVELEDGSQVLIMRESDIIAKVKK